MIETAVEFFLIFGLICDTRHIDGDNADRSGALAGTGESALPGLGLLVGAVGAVQVVGMVLRCAPCLATVLADDGLPAGRR